MEDKNRTENTEKAEEIKSTASIQNRKRIVLLDTLRGLLLIPVILFHLLYDLHFMFGAEIKIMNGRGIYVFRDCFVSLLILLSGICCNLSRSNIKRGIKTLGCALIISLVTGIIIPEEFVFFGILHFFGTAMILCGLTWREIKKVPPTAGCIAMILLFLLTYGIYDVNLSSVLGTGIYEGMDKYVLFILGFNTRCYSADYYPLMPWIFMFFTGVFAGRGIKERKLPELFYRNFCPVITWIGRNTLWIYMLHQPVLYAVLTIVFRFF
ncbi:MAG: heparan-alpha-glucosaminide N-acetyltransferase [Thermoflexaceae bacterium]|nr:heparan-alpha-glucosaminide N-acetyltransferase [Thermoflexaceae bacterium]